VIADNSLFRRCFALLLLPFFAQKVSEIRRLGETDAKFR